MTDVHGIRLHGPWRCDPVVRTARDADGCVRETMSDLPPGGRVRVPCDWGGLLGGDYRGTVRFVRRFGLPTRLEAHETVHLVVGAVAGHAQLWLNERRLGDLPCGDLGGEFDVTSWLRDRNELVLVVSQPPPDRDHEAGEPGGPIGGVRLEIR